MRMVLWGEEDCVSFRGAYHHRVELKLFPKEFHEAGHVVALALYQNQLVFTRHKRRGIEWPGGKVEKGESPLEAMVRELKEETGGVARSVWLVGQYTVFPAGETPFVKNIYVAVISHLVQHYVTGEDTYGPVLCDPNIHPSEEQGYSPLVCDGVFDRVRQTVLKIRSVY
ncbi:NUDIX domain-containing protein [Caldalkalibacillus thermarum TA2.A1]|uniref:NUDIX domain-containing protein n=1 Tax=Caldalkalibacillus thermarum (strain TA2.A1) TaxID=986075 RepID=A0A8X8I6Z0_CALTT|nr:NUDIX domain-containing protein [Caldalkalibacillus thermarum]QZT32614.1 NUDIX domain-containing protein [Caldalkalibacillus thermarum TA2.A1]